MTVLPGIAYEHNATPSFFLYFYFIVLTFDARQGSDWFAVFSKNVPRRRLDIGLVHTLEHDRWVCVAVALEILGM